MSKLLRILGFKKSDEPIPIVSILDQPHWQKILVRAAESIQAPLVEHPPDDGYYVLAKHEQQPIPQGVPVHVAVVDFPLTSPEIALQRAILHVKASRRLNE
jgi:hypothetical protein